VKPVTERLLQICFGLVAVALSLWIGNFFWIKAQQSLLTESNLRQFIADQLQQMARQVPSDSGGKK